MPANQLSVSFSYIYSLELQAVKSAISVIQLYILQNLRPLATSFSKAMCLCVLVPHPFVASTKWQPVYALSMQEGKGKGRGRGDLHAHWQWLLHLLPLLSLAKLFHCEWEKRIFPVLLQEGMHCLSFLCKRIFTMSEKNKSCPSDRVVRWSK